MDATSAMASHMGFLELLQRRHRPAPSVRTEPGGLAASAHAGRHPSVDPGIAACSVDDLLASEAELLQRFKYCYGCDAETFERDIVAPIRRYASYVNLLPATADNFFCSAGGLFRLGLEVAFFALQGTDAHIVSGRATISVRKDLEPRWRRATFLAGLCSELHRTLCAATVTDDQGAITGNVGDGGMTDDTIPVLNGHLEHKMDADAKEELHILDNGFDVTDEGTFTWDNDTDWHWTPKAASALANGEHDFIAQVMDGNGWVGKSSENLTGAPGDSPAYDLTVDNKGPTQKVDIEHILDDQGVVTNIDADHMETYGHDFGRLKKAFVDFLHRMPFYGTAVLCVDDPAIRDILSQVSCPITSYGMSADAQVRAVNVRPMDGQMHFTAQRRNGVVLPDLDVVLNLAGEHNVRNALAAIAIAVELNVPDAAVQKALAEFKGVGRRFQRYGDLSVPRAQGGGRFTVIDDYGHHPVEMAATLAAARGAFPGRRLVLAFQPHRYTRTRDCFEDFVKVIGQADSVLLADVYAAGEEPIVAADGRSLARALRVAGKVEPLFVDDIGALPQAIADTAKAGDVVLCMGAGSIGSVPGKVVSMLLKKEH